MTTSQQSRCWGRELCGQVNLCSGQGLRNGTILLCFERDRLERAFIDVRNVSFHPQLDAGDGKTLSNFVQRDVSHGVEPPWLDSFPQKLHAHPHGETARVGRTDQFLWIGCGLTFFTPGLE